MKNYSPQLKRRTQRWGGFLALLWLLFSVSGVHNLGYAYCGHEKAPAKDCCCGQKTRQGRTCSTNSPSKKATSPQTPRSCPCNIVPSSPSQEERLPPFQPAGSYLLPEQRPLLSLTFSITIPITLYHNPLHLQLIPSNSSLRSPPKV